MQFTLQKTGKRVSGLSWYEHMFGLRNYIRWNIYIYMGCADGR